MIKKLTLSASAAGLVLALGLPAVNASTVAPVAGGSHPGTEATCKVAPTVVTDVTSPEDWSPLTPSKWAFENDEIIQVERGTAPSGPRRPFEYAVLSAGPEFGSLSYEAQVRIDEPIERNDRDVILIFNYQSPTRFYYAHLSQDNTIYPHNGIFVVNDADRLRIDDQWDEAASIGAPPAIDDLDWHDVRLDYSARSGEIAVYVDDSAEPLMTATDTTYSGGRVGFGSFDNYGRVRDVTVTGHRTSGPAPVTTRTHATATARGHKGVRVRVHVHAAKGVKPEGCVEVTHRGDNLGVVQLRRGKGELTIPRGALRPGRHVLKAAYAGSDDAAPSHDLTVVRIGKRHHH